MSNPCLAGALVSVDSTLLLRLPRSRLALNDDCYSLSPVFSEVPLQPPETALTLYWKNGKGATTDGPYAEIKEQLGGILSQTDVFHHSSSVPVS
jgi:hypothetical protein